MNKFLLSFLLVFGLSLAIFTKITHAEGTYYNIDTASSNNGSPDAVSWSQGYPIVIDAFGKFIVPIQEAAQTNYYLAFSNNSGTDWSQQSAGLTLPARVAVAYDAVNDKLYALSAESGNGHVSIRRLIIRRDVDYNITRFTHDETFAPLDLDENGPCSDSSAGNPILLIKEINGTNKLVAFWSISKNNCGLNDFTGTRASYLDITNTGTDDDVGSWHNLDNAPTGVDERSSLVISTDLYSVASVVPFFQHSALIKSSGTNVNDIYYFNIKSNDEHQFIRYDFNTTDWSSGVTTPVAFGGVVNDSQGYNLKRELLTKPVEATGQDSVYVGISRWLDNTNGDTVSLFNTNGTTVNLASDLYSAGGAHCIYPTLDISYDALSNQVYSFYDISGASTVCGHVQYKTYNGSVLSAAQDFYTTTPSRSVDIPVVYQNSYKGKFDLFFRLNNASNAATPPHEIYYGSIAVANNELPEHVEANGPNNNEDLTYTDFNRSCSIKNDVSITDPGFSLGVVTLKNSFLDDFSVPTLPYVRVFDDNWDIPETWTAGTYDPIPDSEVSVFNSSGAYLISRPTFTVGQSIRFNALFTQKNFLHVGIVDSADFNKYAIFSTGGDATLKARSSNGSESSTIIGTSNFGANHEYRIDWQVGAVTFYIDNVQVANITTNIPTGSMKLILSNNDTSGGSNLAVDYIKIMNFADASGTFTSCPIDSQIENARWIDATYNATISAGQSVQFQVRTSNDLTTWSSWSSHIGYGGDIEQPLGRYAQYMVTLTRSGDTSLTPMIDDVNLNFEEVLPPIAVDDAKTTEFETATTVNVLDNDTISSPLDGTSPNISTQATNGTATVTDLVGGVITYTPDAEFFGTDTFQYEICDEYSQCDTATVTITVHDEDEPEPENGGSTGGSTGGASAGVGNAGTTTNNCSETKPGKVIVTSSVSAKPDQINSKFDTSGTITKLSIQVSKLSQTYKDSETITEDKALKEYTFKNLTANTTYYFRIRAENGCAAGDWSTEFRTTTTSIKNNDIPVQGTVSSPVKNTDTGSAFKPEYLLIICCPLGIILLFILAGKKKKDEEKDSTDYNARFK